MNDFISIFALTECPEGKLSGYPISEQTSPARDIRDLIRSEQGQLILLTAIKMAPNVPPVIAFERAIEAFGEEAFSDEAKRYTGYLIRRVVEHMGGAHLEKGVQIKRSSRYTRGSTYRL